MPRRKPRNWMRAGQPNYGGGKPNPMKSSIIDRQRAEAQRMIRRAEQRADISEQRLRAMEQAVERRLAEAQRQQQDNPAGPAADDEPDTGHYASDSTNRPASR